jgi:hypothetical protein
MAPEKPSRAGLTAKQVAVFEQIDQVEGTDDAARERVQELINSLVGKGDEPVTEALTENLKFILKDKGRQWGIECPTCKQPAAPLWTGRQVQFSHSFRKRPGQRSHPVLHSSMSALRTVQLVDRPDQRFRRRK